MNLEIQDDDLINLVGELSADGLVSLHVSDRPSFSVYMTDFHTSGWVYSLLSLALAETLLVESNSMEGFLGLARLILGLLLLGLIPGYSAVRLVFPVEPFTLLERAILSIFLSLLISILSGTLLGAVDSLGSTSTVLVLTVATFILSILAAYRTFEAKTKVSSGKIS